MSRLNSKRGQPQAEHMTVNVAILGAGRIARSMADTLVKMAADPRYENLVSPYAIASRDKSHASEFAQQYGFPVSYGSYEALINDPLVDLVYIATPHNFHAEQGIMCLEAGKNVLVEKSFTANASQARDLLNVAHQTGLLCTEAIWTRYMPSRSIINEIVDSGVIGEVKAINANLCYPVTGKARLTDPALAGGALLDVGVYPLNFIDMVMKNRPIDHIDTSMTPYSTGVDAQNSITLYYQDGTMATAQSSMLTASDRGGYIWGTDGYLVCRNINNVEGVDVYDKNHQLVTTHNIPPQLTGYEYEVADAANAIVDGQSECAAMPHADTLRIMELMDSIRADWGLTYPFEQ